MEITNNTRRTPLCIAGVSIAPGQTGNVPADAWDKVKGRVSIKARIENGDISVGKGGRKAANDGEGDGQGGGGAGKEPSTKAEYKAAIEALGYEAKDELKLDELKALYEEVKKLGPAQ